MSTYWAHKEAVVKKGALFVARQLVFQSPINLLLSALYILAAVWIFPRVIDWLFSNATIHGDSRDACTSTGACWTFIKIYFGRFIYGLYPQPERWRVNSAALIYIIALIPIVFPSRRAAWYHLVGLLIVAPVASFLLLIGGIFGLVPVSSDDWGGLTLNLVLWVSAATGTFPVGVILALGRRSEWPIVRTLSIAYIEFFRGVPLITVLFAASVMVPLFLPAGMSTSRLVRALVALIIFHAAYMAEIVRGGLQGVDSGQYQAARSLGLQYWQLMILVILPQAFRNVLPGIVNLVIDLFKGTSLVSIIGLVDLLSVAQQGSNDPNWLGLYWEGYIFAGLIFFAFCSAMSHYSRRLEHAA